MRTSHLAAVSALLAVLTLGLGMTWTAGAHAPDAVTDPVTTVGHVCEEWGLHNDWGDHHHGDHWTDHDRHPHGNHGGAGTHHGGHGPDHGGAGTHHGGHGSDHGHAR